MEREAKPGGTNALSESVEDAWEAYRFEQVAKARENLSAKAFTNIEKAANAEVEEEMSKTRFKTPKSALKAIVQARIEEHLMQEVGALSEEACFAEWQPGQD